MAHAIWSGTVGFGLVAIPVRLVGAVRGNAGIHFHFLHDADAGRIHAERVCSECGQKVAWEHVVRGFEREKEDYVVVTDEDLKRANVKATQSVDIVQFVSPAEIDPMLFDKPYYLEPEKRGRHAYALLRDALRQSNRVAVARLVIRSREHLAIVRPVGDVLVVELMHWADEIVPPSSLDVPADEKSTTPEMQMATKLIDAMTAKFDKTAFHDTYTEQLTELIERKAEGKPAPAAKGARAATKVVDLLDVLKKSLAEQGGKKAPAPSAKARRGSRKSAA